jgi:hypothetical protein
MASATQPLMNAMGDTSDDLGLAPGLNPRAGNGRVANWGEVDMQEFYFAVQRVIGYRNFAALPIGL